MIRRLLTCLSALSLILCLATAVLWVRSYWISDLVYWGWSDGSLFFVSGGGQFRVEHTSVVDRQWVGVHSGFRHSVDRADGPLINCERMPGSRSVFRGGGFWLVTGERWGEYHHAAFFPAWLPFAVFLALPLRRWLRLKRRSNHRICRACGYDLQATPERCPECGRLVAEGTAERGWSDSSPSNTGLT